MKKNRCNILYLEPFFGGSHENFAMGITEHSRNHIKLVTLPARFWKWRMRGAALQFFKMVDDPAAYDLIFASDLMSYSDLKALWGNRCPPGIIYFHENQLTYPLHPGERVDCRVVFTDITNCLTAEKVIFNSSFHKNSFLKMLPEFIRKMPEFRPTWVIDEIESKSSVIYPGIYTPPPRKDDPHTPTGGDKAGNGPIIIWNHRWEYDKDPELFFRTLYRLDEEDIPFHLVILGENIQKAPKPFLTAKENLGKRILHYGYAEDRNDYVDWLKRGDIVVSTAIQENFGISVAEAVAYGCIPLLPERLSYPELIPEEYHDKCLYRSPGELLDKLRLLCLGEISVRRQKLAEKMREHSWVVRIGEFDRTFEEMAGISGCGHG